ncbi:PH domain-containing protein [Pseudoxanthomonas sp. PXM02]|uniref:PH domain-containing protein n=1 Tax=Pseudoxanthomonas sp. PXM02 TaxID=2769294 RepID=UPI00177FCEDF|nr:PH domain-containing protein [Pseudoxanthomonas sp. PXM02]MBD9480204.1 PH domain-containing protein [Pseudoxanthomonas sp. PXM02]
MEDAVPRDAANERRLHPWSWLFVLLQQLKQFIFPLVALLVFGARRGGGDGELWASLAPVIGIAVLVILAILQYFTYRYTIGRDGLTVREGLLHRSRREIPFSRIHNVVVHQSLLHRLFGVAEVRLESAGGTKPEAEMRVLGLQDALALEDLARHRTQEAPLAASEPGAMPRAEGTTLLSLSTPEVIRLGLISNRGMIVVAAGFGAAWQILPENMIEQFFRQGAKQAYGYAEGLHLGWLTGAAGGIALIGIALALVRLLSVALALSQFHGFRLTEEPRRLMVERGLFARLRTSVSRRRIQAWTLHEGILHRLFGRRSLRIDTAVAEKSGQQDMRALKDVAPIAPPDACDALISHLLPHAHWPRNDWQPVDASARWRLWLPSLAWLLPVTALAAWHLGGWLWLPGLAWMAAAAYAAHRQARRMGWTLDGHLVAVRSGWWSRYWRFAEIDKLQALRLSRSPLDHRCGTATLWLDTAGASGISAPLALRFVPEAEARAVHERLATALAQRRLHW